jgi:hypothetical protein
MSGMVKPCASMIASVQSSGHDASNSSARRRSDLGARLQLLSWLGVGIVSPEVGAEPGVHNGALYQKKWLCISVAKFFDLQQIEVGDRTVGSA